MAAPEIAPPPPRRRLATIAFVVLVGVVAVLSFADRAPDVVREILRSLVGLGRRVEDTLGVDLIDARDLPYSWDVVGHFVLWFGVAVVGWWAFRRRFSAIALGATMFAASYAVEIGQAVFTSTRRPDLADLVANALGIALGLTLAVAAGWLGAALRRLRSPQPVLSR